MPTDFYANFVASVQRLLDLALYFILQPQESWVGILALTHTGFDVLPAFRFACLSIFLSAHLLATGHESQEILNIFHFLSLYFPKKGHLITGLKKKKSGVPCKARVTQCSNQVTGCPSPPPLPWVEFGTGVLKLPFQPGPCP